MKRYEYGKLHGIHLMSETPGGRWLYVVEVADWLREARAELEKAAGIKVDAIDNLLAELEASEP